MFQLSTYTAFFTLFVSVFLNSYIFDLVGRNIYANAVILSTVRFFWGSSIAWIIFACSSGLSEHVNAFLSWKFWIPIARIGLSIFLIHPIIQNNLMIMQGNEVSLDIFYMVKIIRKQATSILLF